MSNYVSKLADPIVYKEFTLTATGEMGRSQFSRGSSNERRAQNITCAIIVHITSFTALSFSQIRIVVFAHTARPNMGKHRKHGVSDNIGNYFRNDSLEGSHVENVVGKFIVSRMTFPGISPLGNNLEQRDSLETHRAEFREE